MIRPSTVVYIVLLLLLIGAYFYLRNRQQPAEIELTLEPTSQASEEYLFTAQDGTPSRIQIESKAGETVEMKRGADNAWALIQPVEAQADQAAAEAAATQISAMSILDTVPDLDPGIVGLENPEYLLTVAFTGGGERTVDVGVITPTESGYYVRDGDEILIVSRSAIDPLLGLLTNPPYLETPEAGTVPSETATPQP